MRKILMVATLALLVAPLTSHAAGKLQCWTDDKGVRACGDRVPPQYAKKDREVLNQRGVVVNTKARQKTPEEIAQETRQIEAVAAEKKRFEDQTQYDKFMLQTFDSVRQMQGVRDTRVITLDGRVKLAERSVADTEKSLKDLRERVAAQEKAGKPADPKLLAQVKQFDDSLVSGLQSMAQMKKERVEINAKFDRDAERYKRLRAGEIQIGSPEAGVPSSP